MMRFILKPAAGLALALDLAAGVMPFRAGAVTLTDTTVADFSAGTPGACYIADTTNGEVLLPPTEGAEFYGTSSYPTPPAPGWDSWLWCTHDGSLCPESGSAEVAGGNLSLLRALAHTVADYAPGRSLEFVATFAGPAGSAAIFQHVGFGATGDSGGTQTFTAEPWAIFSVPDNLTAGVNARVRDTVMEDDGDPVCTNFPTPGTCPCNDGMGNNTNCLGETHRYRIDWTSTQIDFSVDGTLVHHETTKTITGNMRPAASHLNTGSTPLVVDWIRMTPYTSPCTFQSRIFDAGSAASWNTLTATSTLPAGTSLGSFQTRTGNTATPDGTWSVFASVSGTTIVSPAGRYLQYQVTLSSSDPSQTPELEQVGISVGLQMPSQTPTLTPAATPTSTATLPPLPIGADCTSPTRCESTFCVDGVCCDTSCDGPDEHCNRPGDRGTCVSVAAPAPALTTWALVAAASLLAGIAGVALRWRQHADRTAP